MKKILYTLLFAMCFVGSATAADYINTTNIYDISTCEDIGGTDYIIPHQHYWDSWFGVYNDGNIKYMVYQYNYVGGHPDPYLTSFVGILAPNEVITLCSNASYRFYADYDDIQDLGSVETIERKFNQYWFIVIVGLILLIGAYFIYRTVRYK